jgi:phage terminase small subunit
VRKELTELQQKFLNALFGEAKGNHAKAMRLAGYSENTNPHHILQSVRQEIIERAELEMAANAPKAVMSMVGVLDDPTELGVREKLMASQQILDRVGLSKVEKINVETNKPVGLFVLPAKKEENEPLQ